MTAARLAPRLAALVCAGLSCAALAAPAAAQTIGVAAHVRNDVQQIKPTTGPISQGETVVRNEVVRTGADSATKLVFSDNTNLALGPGSTVTLDRFVFAGGDGGYQKATVNLVRGAFRFTTGGSEKRAYEIRTPVATIGVRGTQFGVLSSPTQTVVTLREGTIIVCTRGGAPVCRTASTPGEVIVVTATGVRVLPPGSPGTFDFGQFCGDAALCEVTSFAALQQQGGTFAALCGR